MSGPVDIFMVYMFLKRLVTPFDQTEAFKLGLIDAAGVRLKKAETHAERAAMGYFDRLVFNLKRLLAKVPGGSTQLASFAAALLLLREEDERLVRDRKYLMEQFQKTLHNVNMKDFNRFQRLISESDGAGAPANATGVSVAGTGDDQTAPVGRRRPKVVCYPLMTNVVLRRQETLNKMGKSRRA